VRRARVFGPRSSGSAAAIAVVLSGCFAGIDLGLIDGSLIEDPDGGSDSDAGVIGRDRGIVQRDGGFVFPDANPPRPDAGFGCPPEMVEIPAARPFCIDRAEATNARYALFLQGGGVAQPSECRHNDSFVPRSGWPFEPGRDLFPVHSIDWCDAYAFCSWWGKKLCGRIGGGEVSVADAPNAAQSEWATACSAGGARQFPYEGAYDRMRCNGEGMAAAPIGAFTSCEGGYPGIFDMSGNLEEWVDACDPQPGPGSNDLCVSLGGGFMGVEVQLGCNSWVSDLRSQATASRGVRCCRDL
jgi:formylglycine-generating enzyme